MGGVPSLRNTRFGRIPFHAVTLVSFGQWRQLIPSIQTSMWLASCDPFICADGIASLTKWYVLYLHRCTSDDCCSKALSVLLCFPVLFSCRCCRVVRAKEWFRRLRLPWRAVLGSCDVSK